MRTLSKTSRGLALAITSLLFVMLIPASASAIAANTTITAGPCDIGGTTTADWPIVGTAPPVIGGGNSGLYVGSPPGTPGQTTNYASCPAYPASDPIPFTTARFEFMSTDLGAAFSCEIDGGGFGPCPNFHQSAAPSPSLGMYARYQARYDLLAEGTHTFKVVAPSDLTPAVRVFTVDTIAPGQADITVAPAALSNTTAPSFSFSLPSPATEPVRLLCSIDDTLDPAPPGLYPWDAGPFDYQWRLNDSWDYRYDEDSYSLCDSPFTIPGISNGVHSLSVVAVDDAGNAGPSTAYQWEVDTISPITTITGHPQSVTGDGTASSNSFTFNSSEPFSTLECSLDGVAFTSCTSPTAYGGIADGAHEFRARATDPAGNTGPEASFLWTVDASAPTATITGGPSGATNDASPTFNFISDDVNATFECQMDGGGYSPCVPPETFPGLADGPHTIDVQAIDPFLRTSPPVSQSFDVDTVSPDTSIDSGPVGVVASSTAVFTFSSLDPTATFECRLDGAVFAACTSPLTYLNLTSAVHDFDVRAVDLVGNADPTPATRSWTVNVPLVTLDVTKTGFGAGSVTSSPAGIVCGATCSLDYELSLAEVVTLTATAGAGSSFTGWSGSGCTGTGTCVVTMDASRSVTADFAQVLTPNTTITQGPCASLSTLGAPPGDCPGTLADPVSYTAAVFEYFASNASSSFTCNIDGGGFGPCPSVLSANASNTRWKSLLPPLAEGSHSFQVATFGDTTPASHTFTVDLTAPGAAGFSAVPPVLSGSASGTFSFVPPSPVTEPVRTMCRLDDTDGGVLGDLGPGDYQYRTISNEVQRITLTGGTLNDVLTLNWAGNATTAPVTLGAAGFGGVTSGQIQSSLNAISGLGGGETVVSGAVGGPFDVLFSGANVTGSDVPLLTISAASGIGAFVFETAKGGIADTSKPWNYDTQTYTECNSPLTITGLTNGTHTMSVVAQDQAGNAGPVDVYQWRVDTVRPIATITGNPTLVMDNGNATFTFSSNEANSTFECQVDGGGFTSCTSPKSYVGLADASHTFQVRAIDEVGNIGNPDSFTWSVDSTAPTTTITSGPSGPTSVVPSVFAFISDDANATFRCRMDAGALLPCASPESYAGLADGVHTFEVNAVDAFGRSDLTPDTRTFTLDATAPDTSLDSFPPDPSASLSAAFTFSSPEVGATFECDLDGGGYSACTSPLNYNNLSNGAHTFTVRARDAGGNFDLTPATYTWNIAVVISTLTVTKSGAGSGTVTSLPAAVNCGATCSVPYDSGLSEVVTLSAAPSPGSTFTGWSGSGCSGTGTCVVTMSASRAVSAAFSITPPATLTVNKTGAGTGTVTSGDSNINCGGTCAHDYNASASTVVVLTATPDVGSSFSGWTGSGCGGTGTCTVTMSTARTVTARFEVPQPDAMIRKKSASVYKGNGIYAADGTGQIVDANLRNGRTASYSIKIENDGPFAERFVVNGCSGGPNMVVSYTSGGGSVTNSVTAGTHLTPILAPGGSTTYGLAIKRTSATANPLNCLVRATSQFGGATDAVIAKIILV